MRTIGLLLAFLVSLGFGASLIAQGPSLSPAQPSMQDALASVVRQLGSCQSDLGSLRTLQADVISGKYLELENVKAMIEAANPSLVFDVKTHKLTAKVEESKK